MTLFKRLAGLFLLALSLLVAANVTDCCLLGATPLFDMMRVSVPLEPDLGPPLLSVAWQPLAGYLPNPSMGWQDTQPQAPRFGETVGYTRFNWDEANPAPGQYDWSAIEALRAAVPAGGQISFRVRPARPPGWGNGQAMPQWVVDLGVPIVRDSRGTEPYYASCLYLETQGFFVDALRQQYDGDPDIAFIDIGSYGQYGEWWTDQYDENIGSLDWHARRRIIDMYLGGSGVRPCLDSNGQEVRVRYDYAGFQQTQLVMPYAPWFEDSLNYALSRRQDVGIRHDGLGSAEHQARFAQKAGDLVQERWPAAPIVFEFASNADSLPALESARQFAREMHASYIHDNLNGRGHSGLLEGMLGEIGYRLYLKQMSYRSPVAAGALFSFVMTWQNRGIAPPYFDMPLQVRLLDEAGRVAYQQSLEVNLRRWLPGTPVTWRGDGMLPASLLPGTYRLQLAFVRPGTGLPALSLATAGEYEGGWLVAGPVEVRP